MASTINATTSSGIVATADNTGSLALQTSGTTALTIDTSQNVGIGTSSPSTKLQTSSSGNNWITIASTGTTGQEVGTIFNAPTSSGASNQWKIGTNSTIDNEFTLYDITSSQIVNRYIRGASGYSSFWTNGTERMRIDSSGNALIGTTRNDYGTLSVVNNSSTFATNQAYAYFKGSQAGDVSMPGLYIVKYDNNTTTSQILVKFGSNNGAAGQGQINANGGSAAAFGTFSDSRLKENIEPLPPQLDNILALKPSEFDYKDGSGHQIGFIAQEMQEVYPDVVAAGEDEMLMITGWDKTSARLVKAIQEQQELIKQLQADVAELKGAK